MKASTIILFSGLFMTLFISCVEAVPISDSTALSSGQINALQALRAPGSIPIGTVIPWPSDQKIPAPMWVPCNGQSIDPASPLGKALGDKAVVPDLNGFRNTMESNGNGFFLRGGAVAGVTSTDTIRRQYHKQDPHTHQVSLKVEKPGVSGTAEGQLYFDWITGEGFAASDNAEERANFKGLNVSSSVFRKFQYNVDMRLVDVPDPAYKELDIPSYVESARAHRVFSQPGDPYFFTSSGILGGFAFTIPEAPVTSRFVTDDKGKGDVNINISHEGAMDTGDPRFTTAEKAYSRYLGVISNETKGGKIQDKTGGLVDTTVGGVNGELPIEYDGGNNYEFTGDAETTPQYKNVVFIIKALP